MSRRSFRYDPVTKEMYEVGVRDDGPTGMMIMGDLPAYESPIDGKVVDGRAARREDLKRTGCREYDPSEKEHFMRARAADDAKLEQSINRTVEKFFYEGPPRRRELLVQALQAGLDPVTIRR